MGVPSVGRGHRALYKRVRRTLVERCIQTSIASVRPIPRVINLFHGLFSCLMWRFVAHHARHAVFVEWLLTKKCKQWFEGQRLIFVDVVVDHNAVVGRSPSARRALAWNS